MANKVDAFKVVVTDSNAPSQRLSSKGGGGVVKCDNRVHNVPKWGGGEWHDVNINLQMSKENKYQLKNVKKYKFLKDEPNNRQAVYLERQAKLCPTDNE